MSLKLYSSAQGRTTKILHTAALAQVPVELVVLTHEQFKTPEHLKRNPLGKVPALETPEGPLFESNAIVRYVARQNPAAGLYGQNPFEEAQVDQWVDFITSEVEPVWMPLMLSALGRTPIDPAHVSQVQSDLTKRLQVLDNHLKNNKFFVGEQQTIADVVALFLVAGAFTFLVGEGQRKSLPNLVRWHDTVTAVAEYKQLAGRTRLCKTAFPLFQAAATPAPVKEQQEKKEKPAKKEEKKKEEKPKAAQQPAQKPAPKDDDEKPAPKQGNPLDALPPSTFDIDAWKRQFLAAKDAEGMKKEFEWFWQNFDDQGWSAWEILYEKDPAEGKMLIKTNNTMKGFLQRTDVHFRKYAFAIHGVYGEEPDLEIRGAWMWRGVDIPFEMRDHPSFEYHKFNKIDKNNQEHRQLFEDYWINQEEDVSVVKGLRARTLVYFR